MESDDSLDGIRPPTGELPPDVWAANLIQQLDPSDSSEQAIQEPVADVSDEHELDEAAWEKKLAAARARADAEETHTEAPVLVAEPAGEAEAADDNDGIADETGPHETLTAEVPKQALESLIAESTPSPESMQIPAPEVAEAELFPESQKVPDSAVITAPGIAPADELLAQTREPEAPVVAPAAVEPVVATAMPATSFAELAPVVELLRAGRCILVAGPRLGPHPLAIRDVLARLVAALPSDDVREVWPVLQARPLSAAGFVARRLGDRFALSLAALGAGALPDVVAHLGALPFRGVITARVDDWFDRALVRDEVAPAQFTARDGAALRAHGKLPFVLKLLGDPARPETLAWSNEGLQTALADGELRAALAELWRTKSFVFVGFDAGDLEFSLITERFLAGVTPGETEHYALLPGVGALERDELFAAWRLRVLELPTESFVGAVAEAIASLEEQLPEDDDAAGWLALYAAQPTRKDAIERLDRLAVELREKGDLDGLLELTLARVDVEPEARRRGEALLQLARMFEYEADDAARALTALLAAYREDPSQADWHELQRISDAANGWDEVAGELGTIATLPARFRLELARKQERWADVVRTLDELAATPGEDASALKREAAELSAGRLDDRTAAIARYEALVVETPSDLGVLRALDLLYEAEGRQVEYLENLERQADATDDRHERAATYRRLALLWEDERGGATRAEQCWQTLLTIEPNAEDALRALERSYRAGRRFPALVEALRRRADLASLPMRAEIYCEIGSIYEHELGDQEKAIEAHLLAEQASPQHEPSLIALARLFDETGAWHSSVDRLIKRAKLMASPSDALPLYLRAGELAVARLDDPAQAETHYARALEIDPTNVPARVALAQLHTRAGAPLRSAKLLVEAVEHTTNHLERTQYLVDAAKLYEEVDDEVKATELYLLALELDPEHVFAGTRVADLLWRQGRWGELVPVLEMLTRKDAEPEEQLERLLRLARSARSAEQPDKAARAWARAADLAPSSLEAQRGHADTLLAGDDFAGALQSLERIFQYHVDALDAADRAKLFADLARCEVKLNAKESAREFVARALEADPAYRPALLLQADLSDADPQSLVEAKRALCVTAPPSEQVRLLDEIGDLYLKSLYDAQRAVGAWAEALELVPDDHRIMHKMLDAFVEDRAWPQALEVLERLIAAEKSDAVRAKYHHTAGLILRDELKDSSQAAAHLRAALDDDPELDRAARALEEVCKALGEWNELGRLYRRRLKTLGPESPENADNKNHERLRIWTELGDLCLRTLGEPQSAIAAFEAALSFDRENLDRQKQLADLYIEAGPDAIDKAVALHQTVLRREKSRVASYRALRALYAAMRERDRAFACSYALHFLKKGDADDARAVAELKERPLATARRPLDEQTWALALHPEEDRLIDHLFALVGPTIAAGHAQTHKLAGLNRKDAIEPDDRRSFSKALKYVTTTLDVAMPEAYERPEQRESVLFVNTVAGPELVPVFQLGAPLVGDRRREPEQVFELGRRGALLRPERLLRLAAPHPQQIAHVLDAAVALVYDAEGAPPTPQPELQRTVAGLKRALPQLQLEQVLAVGKKIRETGMRTDEAAVQWLQATDLTSIRVGYALVGDLETCARLVAADGRPTGCKSPTERLLDLIWSSVTEEMFLVRRHLGLQ
ncbi:MAG TPA: SIR2 family protein [Polyangia bacterium]|nr:SIR2 family protein [Polyangia bacterium]